jgi:hypothetical protein
VEPERQPRLIASRRTAFIVLVLTALVGVSTFRSLFLHSPVSPNWLPMGTMLPRWLNTPFDVAIYGYLLWLCFWFFRAARGKERLVVAGWCPGLLLAPLKHFVADADISVIEHVEAVGIAVAFVATFLILIEHRVGPK